MANGPRTIYSRRQRMAPGQYDTPLADFLDRLPDYVNQFQQNQLAIGRQKLQAQRYQDSVRRYEDEQERLKRMEDFNVAKAIGDPKVMVKYLKDYGKYEEASQLEKSTDKFDDFNSEYSSIINMPLNDMYENFDKLKEVKDKSTVLASEFASDKSGRGMYLRNANKNLISIINKIQSDAGTFKPIEDYTPTAQSMFKSYEKARNTAQGRLSELEPQLLSIITRFKGDEKRAKNDAGYQSVQSSILLEKDNILKYSQGMSNIQSKYRYPELADETMTFSEETDFVVDNDDLILSNPDLAEKLQVWLDDPDNKENYDIFKSAADDLLSIEKEQDKINNSETEVIKNDRQYATSSLYGEGRDVPIGDKVIEGLLSGIKDVAKGLPLPIPGGPIFGEGAPEEDSPASSLRTVGPTQINDQQALDILENFK